MILEYFTVAKLIGVFCALCTVGYLLYFTIKHRAEFWNAIKGDNGKLDTLEALLLVWMILFVAMIISDFALGLRASEEAWYSMDAVFLFSVGGKTFSARERGVNPPPTDNK